jgi:lysophospholipase L1-like esterase
VAAAAGAWFVPLQSVFDARAAETGPEAWAKDGVHPTPAGHALIAERWRAAVGL